MKAPDKVYVSIGPRQSLITRAGQTLKSDIEYIRKDALLELLKQKRVAVIDCSATDERKVAALSVIDFLIDKITHYDYCGLD